MKQCKCPLTDEVNRGGWRATCSGNSEGLQPHPTANTNLRNAIPCGKASHQQHMPQDYTDISFSKGQNQTVYDIEIQKHDTLQGKSAEHSATSGSHREETGSLSSGAQATFRRQNFFFSWMVVYIVLFYTSYLYFYIFAS